MVWASYKGHAEIVRELLNYGADPNERGQVTNSPKKKPECS